MNEKKYILISIKPLYAQLIKAGEKTVELRRVVPKVLPGDIIAIYESSPVQRVTAFCEIDEVLAMAPEKLWISLNGKACISKEAFDDYFTGKDIAFGITLKNLSILEQPKRLDEISDNLIAPQSYRYISVDNFNTLNK